MEELLISFLENLKRDRRILSFDLDEASTQQGIVLPVLQLLGWSIFDINEVRPQYSVGAGKVDYSLRISNDDKVFIEVKRIGEQLENHQEQLLKYAFEQGVELAILTNGVTWWFYLPLYGGSWPQRKAYSIDIFQQGSADIASRFVDFLSKDNVSTGTAVENAEAVHKGQQKINRLRETLPKAWNKIIEQADDLLIDLITDTTEELCGFRADPELVREFVSTHRDQLTIAEISAQPATLPPQPPVPQRIPEGYTGKSPSSFSFRGSRYEVRSWRDLLTRLCVVLSDGHPGEFDRVLNIRGRTRRTRDTIRPYFTLNPKELDQPSRIGSTNIFVETKLSANATVSLARKTLAMFGYSDNDLTIEAR